MTTSVSEWRDGRFKEMTLPSGNVMKLKRVGLMDLIEQGGLPDTLSAMASELASKQQVRVLSVAELKQYADVVNLVVKAAAVEPKVADAPSAETLDVHEIDWVDRVQVYNWANGGTTLLRPFRPEAQKRSFPAS